MSYQEVFSELGFIYVGKCPCQYRKGFIFRSGKRMELSVWIFPKSMTIEERIFDKKKSVIKYSDETLKQLLLTLEG